MCVCVCVWKRLRALNLSVAYRTRCRLACACESVTMGMIEKKWKLSVVHLHLMIASNQKKGSKALCDDHFQFNSIRLNLVEVIPLMVRKFPTSSFPFSVYREQGRDYNFQITINTKMFFMFFFFFTHSFVHSFFFNFQFSLFKYQTIHITWIALEISKTRKKRKNEKFSSLIT